MTRDEAETAVSKGLTITDYLGEAVGTVVGFAGPDSLYVRWAGDTFDSIEDFDSLHIAN